MKNRYKEIWAVGLGIIGNAVAVAVLALAAVMLLAGCRSRNLPGSAPMVVTHTSLQSDSLVSLMARMLVQSHRDSRKDSVVTRLVKWERVTVNNSGDTLRTDTRETISSERIICLETENSILRARIDSLSALSQRRDTIEVPVPYEVRVPVPVERELSPWERIRLRSWWVLAAGLIGVAVYRWRVPLWRALRFIFRKIP